MSLRYGQMVDVVAAASYDHRWASGSLLRDVLLSLLTSYDQSMPKGRVPTRVPMCRRCRSCNQHLLAPSPVPCAGRQLSPWPSSIGHISKLTKRDHRGLLNTQVIGGDLDHAIVHHVAPKRVVSGNDDPVVEVFAKVDGSCELLSTVRHNIT